MSSSDGPVSGRITRRGLLTGAVGAGVGIGAAALLDNSARPHEQPAPERAAQVVPFYGSQQAGIATPAQEFLCFAAYDVTVSARSEVQELLREWTVVAAALSRGELAPGPELLTAPPSDPGEAINLGPANLTITVGFGPTLFDIAGHDRFGLRSRWPRALRPLPRFAGEELDPSASGGDLCVQACADDPQVAFHAVHVLTRLASPSAALRWTQLGFGRTSSTGPGQSTPRNLMGFKDGTANIRADEAVAMDRFVWVGPPDIPPWLHGGSYLIARRIRILFDVWDAATLEEQQAAVGRDKRSGAPLGGQNEYDPINLAATRDGELVIPRTAHVRLAHPDENDGQRILRRGYSYSEPVAPGSAQIDAGLFFIAFQRAPTQFVSINRRLAGADALSRHTVHTASSVFACPPGARPGGFVGEGLFN